MSEICDAIKSIIALNGGELVGKIRLQKTFYFLEEKGSNLGLDFEYYRYGPYSEELSDALDFAVLDNEVVESQGDDHWAAAKYTVATESSGKIGDIANDQARTLLAQLRDFSSWHLELAATIHFFLKKGMGLEAALAETRRRKTVKASEERLAKAQDLLDVLNLKAV